MKTKWIVALLIAIFASQSRAANVSWTMVVIPDTQAYWSPFRWEIFNTMTDWIVSQKDARNIQVVLQEGDITHNNTDEQWAGAKEAISRLDGHVPYILVPGNHDYDTYPTYGKMNEYFSLEDNPLNNSPEGIVTTPRVQGDLHNTYSTFTAPDGRKMLIFGLENIPRGSVVTWANSVASQPQFADYTAVLLTHIYLEEGPATPDGEPTAQRHRHGDNLWNGLVSKYANFEMVLNGHFLDGNDVNSEGGKFTTARQVSTGIHGNTVHEMVFNAQEFTNGGNGFLRLLEFMDDGSTVQVRTYSPYLDQWFTGNRHEFQIQLKDITPPIAGDFNDDGSVDAADYIVWRKNGGSEAEYEIWRSHFGESEPSTPPVLPVPEPMWYAMLLPSLFCLRRKHRRTGLVKQRCLAAR